MISAAGAVFHWAIGPLQVGLGCLAKALVLLFLYKLKHCLQGNALSLCHKSEEKEIGNLKIICYNSSFMYNN